jgi:hypothetical protein
MGSGIDAVGTGKSFRITRVVVLTIHSLRNCIGRPRKVSTTIAVMPPAPQGVSSGGSKKHARHHGDHQEQSHAAPP